MTDPTPTAMRQAERLARWYPREWRSRYGDEFVELLASDIAERPASWTRAVDVAVGALMARLNSAGLFGVTADPSDRSRRSLATFAWALVGFLIFAASMWSQLDMARRSASPSGVTQRAILVMTVAVALGVAATAVLTALVVCTGTVAAFRRSQLGLRRTAVAFLSATGLLVAGGIAFRHGWPGAAAHLWPQASTGPGGPAGLIWASTVAVSAYWVHPSVLFSLPAAEITWMFVSPLLLVVATGGAARIIRRVDLPYQLLRFASLAGRVAVFGLVFFVAGTLMWLIDGTSGPGNVYQAGTVDGVGLAVMIVTLAVATRALLRTSSWPSSMAT